jgi:phosphoserine aminotransferase
VPANYKILLMQGGVELVWASVAYNLYYNAKEKNLKAKYVVSGPRSRKAAIEAGKIMGEEKVVLETVDKMVEGDENEYLYSYFCMNDI